jgi:hypothetical protein
MMWPRVLFVAAAIASAACSSSTPSDPDKNLVEALAHVGNAKEAEAKVKARERMEALRQSAAAEVESAREAAFAKLIDVPPELPEDLETACKEMVAAYDDFTTSRLDAEELPRWTAVKARDLENIEEHCLAQGNVRVAACENHALRNAPTDFVAGDATHIVSQCEDKLAAGGSKVAAGQP